MKMTDYHYVFVHGYKGSSKTDWFPGMGKLLSDRKISYCIPDLPGGLWNRYPNGRLWENIMEDKLRGQKKPAILIGFSLGTRAVLNYIENHNTRFDLVILIAPPKNNPLLSLGHYGAFFSFFSRFLDLSVIRKRVRHFVVVASEDDPSVPYKWSEELARELGADLVTFQDKGHINAPRCAEDIHTILTKFVSQLEKEK